MIEAKDYQQGRRKKAALAFDLGGISAILFTMVLHHAGDESAAVILFDEAPITKKIGDKAKILRFRTYWR
jgi:hypothetical protein